MNPKNNQNNPIFKSWNVIYPVFIYFVVMNLSMTVFTMFAVFLGADPQEQYMMLQTASVAVTIPFIARYYQKDKTQPTVFWKYLDQKLERKTMAVKVVNGILMFLAGAAAGLALNNLFMLTSLEEISQGYQEANTQFFAGGVLFELLGACLMTPFLEELLYRSVVYGRLCDLMIGDNEESDLSKQKKNRRSRIIAMVISSLLFGVLHMNLVQFIYAGILGMFLVWFMEKAGHFYGAFLAHMGANLMSVLRVETKLFSWMEPGKTVFYTATAVLAVLVILLIVIIQVMNRNHSENK